MIHKPKKIACRKMNGMLPANRVMVSAVRACQLAAAASACRRRQSARMLRSKTGSTASSLRL
jgi:hypothetical protein